MTERTRHTAVFDIIGTCFTLDTPRQALVDLGAPAHALDRWFARALRDSFAFSHAGGYVPLKEVLAAELSRTLAELGIEADSQAVGSVMACFAALDPREDFADAVSQLVEAEWRVVALTNGSEESTRGLLERAGVANRFAALFSCDATRVTKPNRAVYELATRDAVGDVWMIAAHGWDVAGASRAGLRTAFITTVEHGYLDVFPPPDVVADSLDSTVRAMLRA